ncbi:MAG TPA: FAD-dependent oxidoreductase [Pirellulales bacterium]|nr:FAD-dependent oxidoreductase [Pirellulales bacterium]
MQKQQVSIGTICRRSLVAIVDLVFSVVAVADDRPFVLNEPPPADEPAGASFDICVYGGTSAGVIAAVAARRMGKTVVIVEPKRHVGGLTIGGLGQTDVGRRRAVAGLARQFYRDVGTHYGVFEAWNFEPHVAAEVMEGYVRDRQIVVFPQRRIASVEKEAARIARIEIEDAAAEPTRPKRSIAAAEFIDCSYEGDLMARAGVAYTVGREANSVYGETKNGVQPGPRHQFPNGVSPYVEPGDPSSGLIYGVSPEPVAATGTGDKKVQAYCFRLCLSRDLANQIPIAMPERYDPARYELLRRWIAAARPSSLGQLLIVSGMPNRKTDINSLAGQSTDFHMANWRYPNADYAERTRIWKEHEDYTRGLVYFLGHDATVPEAIRREMLAYGWPKDEYQDNGGFTSELYVREARRMIGEYVMTEHDCLSHRAIGDGVAYGSYNMDSHHTQTAIVGGMVKNEGEVTVRLDRAYPISYRALTPKRTECVNLLSPVCLSASHIAYGSIRMEPVFMGLGQAAGMAAAMAIDAGSSVQEIDTLALVDRLRRDPYLDGRPADVYVAWDHEPDRVSWVGDWEVRVEQRWDSNERLLFVANPAPRQRVRFSVPVERAGRYDVLFYNPENRGALKSGRLRIVVKGGGEERISQFDPAAQQGANRSLFSVGQFDFDAGAVADIELVADGAGVAAQAMYVGLAAVKPQ